MKREAGKRKARPVPYYIERALLRLADPRSEGFDLAMHATSLLPDTCRIVGVRLCNTWQRWYDAQPSEVGHVSKGR